MLGKNNPVLLGQILKFGIALNFLVFKSNKHDLNLTLNVNTALVNN